MARELRTILVPTDFSQHAEGALDFALDLARRFGAELQLLHVYDYPTYLLPEGGLMPGADLLGDIQGETERRFKQLEIRLAGSLVPMRTVSRQGVPLVEILRYAREIQADLIVMGTHGRTGIKHFLIGSVAEKVVRKAPCPVLTVRPPGFQFEQP